MRRPARRRFVSLLAGLGAAGLIPARAQSEGYDEALRKLTGGAAVKAGRVTIDTPRLADNGHSVPFEVSVASPMTAATPSHIVSASTPEPNAGRSTRSVTRPSATLTRTDAIANANAPATAIQNGFGCVRM